ncbi:hypothetical protein EJ08DRAFT_609485 [Tothia fuscella]|uniref:Bacterial low temperature requirement A protein-domain-containing protein n=1 Tax=Tothia fuscella TaxID=1048955 RepID=A0A9P4U0S5_9PEZI|nr:hypothetical protein EJ08DRAFT_609485 [Tothia fuscella]
MAHNHQDHDHDVEKASGLNTPENKTQNISSITIQAVGSTTPPQHHHHSGKRLRHFLRPNGKKVHIAHSPDEVERLKRSLSVSDPAGEGFDVVIHGSLDHIEALRESHKHHEDAREALRIKHGEEFERFENVVRELDKLGTELHMVSEHAVQLDASFEKFGYSAHLRTLPNSGGNSSANSLHAGEDHADDHESHHSSWKAAKQQGTPMMFFKKPIIRQYFHKGLLWRAPQSQEVASYELFCDLFYVGIIAIAGDGAAHEATGQALLRFVIVTILSWKFWGDIQYIVSTFEADDMFRRFFILFVLVCLLGFTTNIANSWEETWTPLISFYVASRWVGSLYFLWMSYLIPMVRPFLVANAIVNFLPGLVWIGSCHVEEPNRQALIWIALLLDLFGILFLVAFLRGMLGGGQRLKDCLKKVFEFMPGANIEHKIERTNAFIGLVFGYSVIALLYQSRVPFGINDFFGKAVLGLIQAFTFNWLYFEIDTFNIHTHAIRRHFASSIIWIAAHLPFVLSYILAASALSKLVLAHDTTGSNYHDLYEPFDERSEEHVSIGLRWFYCAGLSLALMGMTAIAHTHTFKVIPNTRLRKEYRLAYRIVVAIIILLLPLAHDHLNSLHLVATTTSLVVTVLVMELMGSACTQHEFWGLGGEKRKCTYSARCHVSRKIIESKLKSGEVLNVEEVAEKDGNGLQVQGGYIM